MTKRILLPLAVAALVCVLAGPWIFVKYVEGAPDPLLKLPSERHPATVGMDGTWVVVPGSGDAAQRSQAGYRADQALLWETVTVSGRTTGVTGSLTVVGGSLQSATFAVEVASIQSPHHGRDNKFRSQDVMDTGKFATAQLKIADPVDLSAVPDDGAPASMQIAAALTLKGVTRQAAVRLDVQRSGDHVVVVGQIQLNFADYNISPPSPPAGILQVQPIASVEFLVNLAQQPA